MKRLAILTVLASLACHAGDIKVACVGNSITYGYGLSSPYFESYPTRLDTMLGDGYEALNFGVSGKTMTHTSDAYWTQSAFTAARDSLPNIVVIELGTNDSRTYQWPYYKGEFLADYEAMIDTFHNLSSSPAMWVTLQPRANNSEWNMYDTTIARQVNPLILQAALEKGAGVIDLRTAFDGHGEWMQSDSVHPNVTGAWQLAKTVYGMISRAPIHITANGSILTAPAGSGFQWYRNDSLLAGDTLSTLTASADGNYKVSVKVESGTASRQVSEVYVFKATSAIGGNSVNPVRVRCDQWGNVRMEGAPAGAVLELHDTYGRKVTPPHIHGICTYTVRQQGQLLTYGTIVAP